MTVLQPQLYPQQLGRETGRIGAFRCEPSTPSIGSAGSRKDRESLISAPLGDALRPRAEVERKGLEPSTSSLQSCEPSATY